jgi:hypothetical protein
MPAALAARRLEGRLRAAVLVFVLSSFLDNIAAAMIGGTMAHGVSRQVHIGYLAAIVAASNAGGAGSVVGDTTTTMMWIAGVPPLAGARGYVARCRRCCSSRHRGARSSSASADREGRAGRARSTGAARDRRVILLAAIARTSYFNCTHPRCSTACRDRLRGGSRSADRAGCAARLELLPAPRAASYSCSRWCCARR